jgi:signal transduction histidine kinase
VHHDVRNGLIPIRNVISHLTQVARETPEQTSQVLLERERTLTSSVQYLQSLATHYARLSPPLERLPCDLNRVIEGVLNDAALTLQGGAHPAPSVRLERDLHGGLPPVLADPVALRRLLDNLVVNAVESLGEAPAARAGSVTVRTRVLPGEGGSRVQLEVADSGRGMTDEERAHMFDDFYTTKPRGTGLGLSIVRRVVNDLGGRLSVESAPGEGTRFLVELPAAPAGSGGAPAEQGGPTSAAGLEDPRSDAARAPSPAGPGTDRRHP